MVGAPGTRRERMVVGPEWKAGRLRRAPRTVVGYHGCSRETAERVIAGQPFVPSTRRYDWLGVGIYFWEYGPFRAREWAEIRFEAEAAVLERASGSAGVSTCWTSSITQTSSGRTRRRSRRRVSREHRSPRTPRMGVTTGTGKWS